ncbi:hypothetical protein P3T76_006622 [Phytophthora citrophthora]|uniref:Uncharacterized protein n=1 Tax=Phytophthora citrophthora TaxID=4793 RepID=A0AAD9GPN0_9STRA|nr:hypothetical protein P3T76_006622 [Phytophthora citrophthora]
MQSMEKRERRTRGGPVCQNQSGTSEKYSLCGLYSVNNAVQSRDFLSVEWLAPIVHRLNAAAEEQGTDSHGDVKYGGYSTAALHEALRAKGYQLRYLNKTSTFNCSAKKWFKKLALSKVKHLIIIGRASGQKEGTWHCIARAEVSEKFYFIDSDEFDYKPSTEAGLRHFFAEVSGIYAVEAIKSSE